MIYRPGDSSGPKDAQKIVDFVLERVGQASRRPHMYGGSAEGVDLLFWNYFELWAFATGHVEQIEVAKSKVYADAECGAMGISHCYLHNNPGASDKAAMKYVVRQWLAIAENVAVPIPWVAIDKDLEELRDYIQGWRATD